MITKQTRLRLEYKVAILIILMVFFVLAVTGAIVIRISDQYIENSTGKKALAIGEVIASVPSVQEALLSDNPSAVLQPFAERWRRATGAAFIVISNMHEVRLSYPLPDMVGTPMADLYREPVLEGKEYVYTGQGHLAPSLRANVPIFARSGRQVGFVSVGFYLNDISKVILTNSRHIMFTLVFALVLSAMGAFLLARNIKQAIFGLEPYEIAMVLKEREATLEAIREGVVAVDTAGIIRLMNREAEHILGLRDQEAAARPITDILPQNGLDTVIREGRPLYNEEQRVGDITILANSVPIMVDGQVAGAVISFRDRTEINRLAEEMTGVHRFVDVLRAQTHEFKNKLHTIAGLIQLGRHQEAVNYAVDTTEENKEVISQLSGKIKDSLLYGMLLGKASHMREQGIAFSILPETELRYLPACVSVGDVLLILGNLLQNAVEATAGASEKKIVVGVIQQPEVLTMIVCNSGGEIDDATAARMYQRGVTTKNGNSGLGLALVAEKLKLVHGSIVHRNLPEGGVEFTVRIPYETGDADGY
ncbi:ATP-binding protein [Lucifera butyrica]|uniref:ATP-binding protein n=1 Tax=Lucifera butyrica TaxID=1351585 RepID=UPI001A9D673C|nr:sensor histidine kinase [Lucifera butyrica]